MCHKFVQNVMVKRRKHVGEETRAALRERQGNRCGICDDSLSASELHHRTPKCTGGDDHIDNLVLLCRMCHSAETEKQEQALCRSNVWLESRLSPAMYNMFAETPCPRHIIWGDNERQAEAKQRGTEDVTCMDVVGCRLNCFMERTRPCR